MSVFLVNAYCTHRNPPALAFEHDLKARRDTSDPELARHLRGFQGFVMAGGKRQMTAVRYGVLRHIERVRHHLALEVDESQLEELALWALEANALLFLDDGTVRGPNGLVLVDPDTGDPEDGAQVPYPLAAERRKDATRVFLEQRGIRTPSHLPPVIDETEVEFRSPSDVLGRCCALVAVAARAEGAQQSNQLPLEQIERRLPLALAHASPAERAFLAEEAPGEQAIINMMWRYEALGALMWSIQLLPELPLPTALVDVPLVTRTMLELDTSKPVQLRSTSEILDTLDMTFRLHWSTTDARFKGEPSPAKIAPGVVMERHHALNWLVRFEGAEWDDVQTPT
ncbi:MAG: DUF4272 domain-containing protein [Kofleriaceae bacterium]|nr:DUF4272 domain-containing protein [Kofleriaceae bacterium]